jgi:SAM-dependent methyltransferase
MNTPGSQVIAHYQKHAHSWDQDRQKVWNDKIWHDRFISLLPAGASVLELGCGSGWPVSRHLVENGLSVTGIDSSPQMIELCRERLPGQEWIVGDMRKVALERRFQGILAWDSFFHLEFDDQRGMFPIFANHACPGAHLMFNSGPQLGEAIGEYKGDPLYHASLDPLEYGALLQGHGFEVIRHRANDPEAGGRTVWLARRS